MDIYPHLAPYLPLFALLILAAVFVIPLTVLSLADTPGGGGLRGFLTSAIDKKTGGAISGSSSSGGGPSASSQASSSPASASPGAPTGGGGPSAPATGAGASGGQAGSGTAPAAGTPAKPDRSKVKPQLHGLLDRIPGLENDPTAIEELTRWHDGWEAGGKSSKAVKALAEFIGPTWASLLEKQGPDAVAAALAKLQAGEPPAGQGAPSGGQRDEVADWVNQKKREEAIAAFNGQIDAAVKGVQGITEGRGKLLSRILRFPFEADQTNVADASVSFAADLAALIDAEVKAAVEKVQKGAKDQAAGAGVVEHPEKDKAVKPNGKEPTFGTGQVEKFKGNVFKRVMGMAATGK